MTDSPDFTTISSLGAFSISLPVEDLAASVAFYEKLGFTAMGGDGESWIILVNGSTTVGLFHGMFDKPMLTFNPGWGPGAFELPEFTDVRQVRQVLVDDGVAVEGDTTQDSDAGPALFMVMDPDGMPRESARCASIGWFVPSMRHSI